jgi:hypothetical protein
VRFLLLDTNNNSTINSRRFAIVTRHCFINRSSLLTRLCFVPFGGETPA